MYKINYNSQDSIIRLILSGSLTIELIEEISIELYLKNKQRDFLLLTDVRGVIYDFNFKDFDSLIELTNKYINPDVLIHEAILIDSPRETAISTLFDLAHKRKNHLFKIFSTEKAAIAWLLDKRKLLTTANI